MAMSRSKSQIPAPFPLGGEDGIQEQMSQRGQLNHSAEKLRREDEVYREHVLAEEARTRFKKD